MNINFHFKANKICYVITRESKIDFKICKLDVIDVKVVITLSEAKTIFKFLIA